MNQSKLREKIVVWSLELFYTRIEGGVLLREWHKRERVRRGGSINQVSPQ